jgi:hypothetical protein
MTTAPLSMVYVLTDSAMPGLVKIGHTAQPPSRLRDEIPS